MRLVYKRFSVIAGFGVLLVLLLVNTAVTRRQLAVQDSDQELVQHTQAVLLEIAGFESLLKDAETGQRGYLYTGDPQYLAPYNTALKQGQPHLDRLAQLTADNPGQQQRIARLRELRQQKLDELADTIEAYDAGRKDIAQSIVMSNRGKAIMDQIRAVDEDVRKAESSLLATRLRQVDSSTRNLVRTLYLTTIIAALGLILLALLILREFDEREKHAAEIRDREEWFRVTLASIGDAVIATDRNGVVTFINPIASQLIGIKPGDAQGQRVDKVFPIYNEQTGKAVDNPVGKVLEHGRIMGLANHTVLRSQDGSMIPIEDSAAPILDDRGHLRGVVMVFRDVSAEKKAQQVLHRAEKLAAAGRLAATVAHEINNPLEAVCNLIYIVKNTPGLPEEARKYLKIAEGELDRVSHITRQTLGFYRESAEPVAVSLPDVVRSVVSLYHNKLKSKNISVQLDLAECAPVRGMEGELKQLVANLVSNAADAVNPGGSITILLRPAASQPEAGLELAVVDDGPGVAPEHQSRIFEPFFTTKQDVGTGLGLWVSKEIAERHGGSIVSSSREDGGRGALFKVFIPFVADAATIDGNSSHPSTRS